MSDSIIQLECTLANKNINGLIKDITAECTLVKLKGLALVLAAKPELSHSIRERLQPIFHTLPGFVARQVGPTQVPEFTTAWGSIALLARELGAPELGGVACCRTVTVWVPVFESLQEVGEAQVHLSPDTGSSFTNALVEWRQ